jgi:ankyrin repeat protein
MVRYRISGAIMNIKASLIRLTAVLLIVLGWSLPAFCGEIHEAAKAGDLAKVKALLKENPELVFSRNNWGETPLHRAALFGHNDEAAFLVANKAEVNSKDKYGRTPLHCAVTNGYKEVVKLLLVHGADVNAIDGDDGWTPLHWAANGGHKDVAELLLANKADVNAKDEYGKTSLYYAAGNKRINKGEVRWDDNIDNPVAIDGNTTMHLAELKSRKDAVEELLRKHGGHD